ncbi:DUF2066 domain-containing protein [Kordiimonas aestuarii]|uniref:DUF2066 domain-containing protein n=1 Tax=Kordiimonas aestuarii TaxID=1005925 RepID=UPI0021CECB72|nr:DUF2066 domain-containing protein [Kordiimonas aestuarii]
MKEFMHNYFRNSTIFSLAFVFFAGLSLLFTSSGASARAVEDSTDLLFTIRDIRVDETASRASEARETALEKAEMLAYQKLLGKLVQEDGRNRLPELSRSQVQGLVTALEVVEEQSSSRRYLATLNVRFEPGLVSQFLAKHNVPHVLSTGQGILVLHGHQRGLSEILWEGDPAIKTAHSQVDWVNRIRQYVFARGEIRERAAITFREVQALSAPQAREVAKLYGVQDALLIASRWHHSPGGPILEYCYLSTDNGMTGDGEIIGRENEAEAIAAMYEAVLEAIDTAWRSQLLVDTAVGGKIDVLVPSTSLDILTNVQARLADVTLVRDVRTLQVGLPFSKISFAYTGREEQLILSLRYAGLILGYYGEDRILAPKIEGDQGE